METNPTPTPKEEKQPDKAGNFSEGVLLLILSSIAYLCVFVYKLGDAYYFKLPLEFITVSLDDLLFLGIVAFFVLIFSSIFLLMLIDFFCSRAFGDNLYDSISRETLTVFIVSVAYSFVLWPFIHLQTPYALSIFFGPTIIKLGAEFLQPLKQKLDRKSSFKDALKLWRSRKNKVLNYQLLTISVRTFYKAFILLAISLSFSWSIGYSFARDRVEFFFIGDEAVIQRYNDYLILCKFDKEKGIFTEDFRILPMDDANGNIQLKSIFQYKASPRLPCEIPIPPLHSIPNLSDIPTN